jgi:hypothetical protein
MALFDSLYTKIWQKDLTNQAFIGIVTIVKSIRGKENETAIHKKI